MPYCQLYYHFVWATSNRQPILTDEVHAILARELRRKSKELHAVVYAIGGVEDHVHMVVSVPPTIAIASFIGQIKGGSSYRLRRSTKTRGFAWQTEYGVFTIRREGLGRVVRYVRNQKTHHRLGDLVDFLERC